MRRNVSRCLRSHFNAHPYIYDESEGNLVAHVKGIVAVSGDNVTGRDVTRFLLGPGWQPMSKPMPMIGIRVDAHDEDQGIHELIVVADSDSNCDSGSAAMKSCLKHHTAIRK